MALSAVPLATLAQDHGHLRIGATNTAQGTPLYFYNGPDFAKSSGYVKTLTYTNSGRFAGYYQGNITLTVQAATPEYSGPEPDAPALGSLVRASIVSVQGPAGGAFGFWDAGSTSPTISVASGETGTSTFAVTQTDGSPGADPFGHIHGRRMSAMRPGIYTVTFLAFDACTNGESGGPIHGPAETVQVTFQAGINIDTIKTVGGGMEVRFGAMANRNFTLEWAPDLSPGTVWTTVSGPLQGSDYFQILTDSTSAGATRFYRILATSP
jgi:hypothetical protein